MNKRVVIKKAIELLLKEDSWSGGYSCFALYKALGLDRFDAQSHPLLEKYKRKVLVDGAVIVHADERSGPGPKTMALRVRALKALADGRYSRMKAMQRELNRHRELHYGVL